MNIIVLATRNQGKTREIQALLKGFPVEIKNLEDFGPIPEVEEDGETFDDNAYKKAAFAARVLGYPAIADDSGLEVEALGGKPGVRSARFAGENVTDKENSEKLLREMKGKTNRAAAFKCVVSIAIPTGPALTYEGECHGTILEEPRGENGFGYDPLFFHADFNKTFAEISMADKGRVSHRGKAFQEVAAEFDKVLDWIDINMPEIEKVPCVK
ncbi:MAG: XTP/dITP diphosphatase [Desulfobacterium sp.]|nr:XTP/dITP diphosphatase [Desulfobacterium sp.]